jgi:DsbC/DsbD-like thiol-disulfide interchange protein
LLVQVRVIFANPLQENHAATFVNHTTVAKYAFSLYPRLISTNTDLTVVLNKTSKMRVQITVNAAVYEKHDYIAVRNEKFNYYPRNLPKGRIVLEVFMDDISKFKGRLNKK